MCWKEKKRDSLEESKNNYPCFIYLTALCPSFPDLWNWIIFQWRNLRGSQRVANSGDSRTRWDSSNRTVTH
jgi:hypothetical protein